MKKLTVACTALMLAVATGASAAPFKYDLPAETAKLRPATGPGFDAAQNNCLSCHSPDYLAMQPPKLGRAFWTAEVAKMVNVFKAKIAPDDAKLIAEYLDANY
ncbi:MAG: cytochrome c [Alphaproteobacteria bacterium]|nr:cytochrome c [Alphaproteobacteria bacterium]